jgi:hypothetical protein
MSSDIWQVVLIDALFLCMAAGMGLWFRAWLARQQQHLDRRLDELEAQHARLERVSGRLQTVSRVLELMGREGGKGLKEKPVPTVPEVRPVPASKQEADFEQAWEMLSAGAEPVAVAQRLGIGVAEVELMNRMMRYRRQV